MTTRLQVRVTRSFLAELTRAVTAFDPGIDRDLALIGLGSADAALERLEHDLTIADAADRLRPQGRRL